MGAKTQTEGVEKHNSGGQSRGKVVSSSPLAGVEAEQWSGERASDGIWSPVKAEREYRAD